MVAGGDSALLRIRGSVVPTTSRDKAVSAELPVDRIV